MVKLGNPLGFTPWPVTIITTLSLVALFGALLTTHHIVPDAPKSPVPAPGVNLTAAWHDLQVLTNGFHPYNSARNDEVRSWLLSRIDEILQSNDVKASRIEGHGYTDQEKSDAGAYIFDDQRSNLTWAVPGSPLAVAYTGLNIMVYIRGSDDPEGNWWMSPESNPDKYLVMLNAHYDSVSSGYGATDDGVGVICVLQAISHFTATKKQPRRGVLALLNNGEEDFLNGAYAFSQHPISNHIHTFLNLEGAGAGGRAALFRSTDTEVTRFYGKSPRPFGTAVSGDGFKRRLIRSETDYSVFAGQLGMRGLDVAFMDPRSRYHTVEDSARFTSMNSVWHMLSATLATMDGLSSDTSADFEGENARRDGVHAGQGSDAVWFDLLGRTFAILQLHDFFAISVSLLVVAPVLLIIMAVILGKTQKWYLFARKAYPELHSHDEVVYLGGWRGLFRAPITIAVASAAVVGLAYLVVKINPYICYSSEYSVWSMMLSAFFFISWFLYRGADSVRPSALQRTFTIWWIFVFMYIILVGDTILENNFQLAGGYFTVIYFAAAFVALFIAYLELFALPKKSVYAQLANGWVIETHSRPATARSDAASERLIAADDDADERTSLLRDDNRNTFGRGYGGRGQTIIERAGDDEDEFDLPLPKPYGREQKWSGKLPGWTWILQFLCLAPVPIILVGQIGLYVSTALHQTPADGNPVLTIYLLIAVLSIFLVMPVLPFIHRFNFSIPTLLLLVCIGTAIYNLVAFPFSENSRLKVYFIQQVDLTTGENQVALAGLPPYVQQIAHSIPSTDGQQLNCSKKGIATRAGLTSCSWNGLAPNVLDDSTLDPRKTYSSLVTFNATRHANTSTSSNAATFHIRGRNTRNCRLFFDTPVTSFNVRNYTVDPRFPTVHENSAGVSEIRLWTRQFGGSWIVDVNFGDARMKNTTLDGRVVCLWADANDPKTIPAFDEVMNYMPTWSMVTKGGDGLVEGFKRFKV